MRGLGPYELALIRVNEHKRQAGLIGLVQADIARFTYATAGQQRATAIDEAVYGREHPRGRAHARPSASRGSSS
jgi:ethanolamine utilization microcompartment shell protein EutL